MVKSYRFKFPNFRIGPCGISSAYRAHFPPLIVRARVRIIPCAFRSRWCGNSAVNGAEIPHDRCISAAYHAISAGHYALPQVAVRKFRTVRFGNLYLYANVGNSGGNTKTTPIRKCVGKKHYFTSRQFYPAINIFTI